MGLASFNRMRRARADAEKAEAERFKKWNEARQQRQVVRDAVHQENLQANEGVAELEAKAVQEVHEKIVAGMEPGAADIPLRLDHAAEIEGRDIEGAQEPKDPVERIDERIPQGQTQGEQDVIDLQVEGGTGLSPESKSELAPEKDLPDAATTPEERGGVIGETSAETKSKGIEIPTDWEEQHWTQQVKLAEQIRGSEIHNEGDKTKVEVARQVISDYVSKKS